MTMDPNAPADAAAQDAPAQDAAAPEMMDPESEATAAAAAVEVFNMIPDCVSFSMKQQDDGSVAISCEMGDGSKADYVISAVAVEAAIVEAASEG